jgi:signal transduction histidine kinase
LTLAFAGAMAALLSVLGLFLYLHFRSGLDASLDQQLRARASEVAGLAPTVNLGRRPLRERGENFAQILNAGGRVLDASAGLTEPLLTDAEIAKARHTATLIERHERARLYATPINGGREIVVVGASLAEHEKALEIFGAALVIGGPLALLLASIAGYMLTGAALRPVESMRQRAATISSEGAGAQLPLPESVDEIHRLGSTLNEMLARLQLGLDRERAFVADASHELRAPLAVLKAELEVALMQTAPTTGVHAAVGSAVEETDRIIALAEDLLVLARVEQDSLALEIRQFSAAELLGAVRDLYDPAAKRAGRRLRARAENGAQLSGDPARLRQAISNLVENALRYGGGPIDLYTKRTDGQIEIHVTDGGPGFPPDFLPHAFERFSRADPARSSGGVGLGLSIAEAIARAHHGRARAANRPDGGADVWLLLPASGSQLSG